MRAVTVFQMVPRLSSEVAVVLPAPLRTAWGLRIGHFGRRHRAGGRGQPRGPFAQNPPKPLVLPDVIFDCQAIGGATSPAAVNER
jgi:hypothetical protein